MFDLISIIFFLFNLQFTISYFLLKNLINMPHTENKAYIRIIIEECRRSKII